MTKLFKRFSQANPRTHIEYGGSGIGLYICHKLVDKQDGDIGVASSVGEGSVFGFYIETRRATTPSTKMQHFARTSSDKSGLEVIPSRIEPIARPSMTVKEEPEEGPKRPALTRRLTEPRSIRYNLLLVEDVS